jgi:dodecin
MNVLEGRKWGRRIFKLRGAVASMGRAQLGTSVYYAGRGTHRGKRNDEHANEGVLMAESVYKVIELVGTSSESWEKAAAAAVKRAAKTIRGLRVAEVAQLDMTMKDGKVEAYRAKVKVSFKYEG